MCGAGRGHGAPDRLERQCRRCECAGAKELPMQLVFFSKSPEAHPGKIFAIVLLFDDLSELDHKNR